MPNFVIACVDTYQIAPTVLLRLSRLRAGKIIADLSVREIGKALRAASRPLLGSGII
jgi:hypothetical protein